MNGMTYLTAAFIFSVASVAVSAVYIICTIQSARSSEKLLDARFPDADAEELLYDEYGDKEYIRNYIDEPRLASGSVCDMFDMNKLKKESDASKLPKCRHYR